ncbi:MAG: TPR end-of-group domain-containing protein [Candidatus Brocadiia bacterium]
MRAKALCLAAAWGLLVAAMGTAAGREERAREFIRLSAEAQEHFQARDYEQAAKTCRQMIRLMPDHPIPHYNLACALARRGKTDPALEALEMALFKGFRQPEHMQSDPDLESLRKTKRFAACVERARANARSAGAYQPGPELEGVKTTEGQPEGGLRYRLHQAPDAGPEAPDRLVVWLHPAGGSANQVVEPLAPRLARLGFALLVPTEKDWRSWSQADMEKLVEGTLPAVAQVEGLDARRPILMGYSAGGQAALMLWRQSPGKVGGLILDAAYPVRRAAGGFQVAPPPDDPAAKDTPVFVLAGEKDGGTKVWQKVAPAWGEAGIPLTLVVVPGKGHTWLLGSEQLERLEAWLREVKAGKTPADAPPGESEGEG